MIQPLAYTIATAASATGLSRTTVGDHIASKRDAA